MDLGWYRNDGHFIIPLKRWVGLSRLHGPQLAGGGGRKAERPLCRKSEEYGKDNLTSGRASWVTFWSQGARPHEPPFPVGLQILFAKLTFRLFRPHPARSRFFYWGHHFEMSPKVFFRLIKCRNGSLKFNLSRIFHSSSSWSQLQGSILWVKS